MSRWLWLAAVPILIAAGYLLLLFVVQRSMLFPMPPALPGDPDRSAEAVRVATDNGDAYALFLPSPAGVPAALIMFMHGNGELADYWVGGFDVAREWGFGVLLVEYPGYGRATGSPSEKSITGATRALYDWAVADPRVDATRIVAWGRSLGGGAASQLAVERPVAALILESAFTSVADFAARFMAPAFLIRDRFDSRNALASYHGPLLVMHGRLDTIVPVGHGRELASIVPGAQFRELPCGHNDCQRDWKTIALFLRDAKLVHELTK
jgi:fermentation-respiration switch protein FrsA (DUF1100 family)